MRKYLNGHHKTRTYNSWTNMRKRCNNKTYKGYKDYGGRGISYDPRWESFFAFLEDMGECPEGMSIERKNNDGNYCKENCRWATRKEQFENRRPYKTKNPHQGVRWQKLPRLKNGGYWVAVTRAVKGKKIILYQGPSFEIALEARKFYEEFILGEIPCQ